MAWYRTGSVNVTNGSNAVTGVSTAFIANARVGDAFVGPDGLTYEITNIASNTALSIFPPYRSATANKQAYAIQPVQGYTKTLADRASQLIDNFDKPWNSAEDAAEARSDLGLGSAATKNVGTSPGNLMEVGAFGWGAVATYSSADINVRGLGISGFATTSPNNPFSGSGIVLTSKVTTGTDERIIQLAMENGDSALAQRSKINGVWETEWVYFRSSANTTEDSNGFIKAASPIIKLFADAIETNAQAAEQQIQFIKNGVGDYTITGTSGLAKDGWWIETPKDSNGNTKVIIQELDQIEQPEGTVTLNIKTTEPRYGLDETGHLVGIGEPCDIPDGRWIDIRLNELPAEEAAE